MIVYRERTIDGAGNITDKLHGPMPISEWAAYEKQHIL